MNDHRIVSLGEKKTLTLCNSHVLREPQFDDGLKAALQVRMDTQGVFGVWKAVLWCWAGRTILGNRF